MWRSSASRKREKSLAASASCQACSPTAFARVISAARSAGTRTDFSKSRRAQWIRRASSDSGSSPAAHGSRVSSRRPSAGSVARAWWVRSSVSAMSARAAAPPGGIIVFWSQNISEPSDSRSVSSPMRVRSSVSSAGVAHPPAFA